LRSQIGEPIDASREQFMFLASKAAWAGIVFILLTTGISGPRSTLLASEANLSKEVPAVEHRNDVKEDAANSAGQRTLPR
jgi:hypothetical protein